MSNIKKFLEAVENAQKPGRTTTFTIIARNSDVGNGSHTINLDDEDVKHLEKKYRLLYKKEIQQEIDHLQKQLKSL
jgi:hypothetical protein